MTPSCPTPKKQRYRSEHAARLVIVELAMRQNRGGRPADHRAGLGARLLAVIRDAGISFTVARTWTPATRARERQIKIQGGLSRSCPECGVTPRLVA